MQFIRSACLVCMLLLASMGAGAVDVASLLKELSQQSVTGKAYKLALWMPPEFFALAYANMGANEQRQLKAMLQGYTLFFVADAQLGLMATPIAKPRSDIMGSTHLVLNGGQNIRPVPDAEIGRDLKLFLDTVRPVLQAQMGKVGETLEPLVFRLPKPADQLQAAGSGRVKISISGDEFLWRLPLGSVLPPAFDPDTGDQFPGNYLFSPFTGRKLAPK